jgi:hypothetical protein
MARPVSFFEIGFRDYSLEPSRVSVPVTTLTAANLVAQTALINTLEAAIIATTLGRAQKDTIILERAILSALPPTSVDAQREKKWLVRYHDATTNVKYQAEIPCADLSTLAANSDFMDTANSVFTDLKAAWEAVVRSPDDDNLTVLDSLQFVGRRL